VHSDTSVQFPLSFQSSECCLAASLGEPGTEQHEETRTLRKNTTGTEPLLTMRTELDQMTDGDGNDTNVPDCRWQE